VLEVQKVQLTAEKIKVNQDQKDRDDPEKADLPWTSQACLDRMVQVNTYIKQGADTFLKKEYTYLVIFIAFFAGVVFAAVDQSWQYTNLYGGFPYTTFAFLVGAFTSMIAGFIGMKIATITNVKVTYLCNESQDAGFLVAFSGGQVLGFCLVGLALAILEILILSYKGSVMFFIGDQGTQA